MNKLTIGILLVLAGIAILFLVFSRPASAQDTKIIWGGGAKGASVYTDVYVPHLVNVLENNRLAGYVWGGESQGTLANAAAVTKNPTNLAVGQLDLLRALDGQPLPDGSGNYEFTILAPNIGPECLYLVTGEKGYSTFGDFLGNAWDATVATGGELSGSYGTYKHLSTIYPELSEAIVQNLKDNAAIVAAVKAKQATHGFFVMRPDPQSAIFKAIDDAGLTLIPVVDFGIEDEYEFLELKVAAGFLFDAPTYHTTACTSVALITGDVASPAALALAPRDQKRLQVTIERIGSVPPDALKPNIGTWADMWDSLKVATAQKVGELMEASKEALEDIAKDQTKA